MRNCCLLFLLISVFSCKQEVFQKLNRGTYRAELKVSDSLYLPFVFEVNDETHLKIFNADEIIYIDEVSYKNDSIIIKMPVFEGYLSAKLENDVLIGNFITTNLNRSLPFVAEMNGIRFESKQDAHKNVSGNWEVIFSPNSDVDRYIAKGIFQQVENKVTGTFLTTTGDYRYLEGVVDGDQLKLSTFDGAHAFLFIATLTDSTMKGTFYSGNHWEEPFEAQRNNNFELPDANDLTYLKEGYDKLMFSFPDSNGDLVSLDSARFKNKVVLVQIMGTWCPNCLDESKYYAQYYKANKDKDLEILALAFEYVKTEEKAFKNIKRLQDRIDIEYPILLAQTGTSSKRKAQENYQCLIIF